MVLAQDGRHDLVFNLHGHSPGALDDLLQTLDLLLGLSAVLLKRLPQFWMPSFLPHGVVGLQPLLLSVPELGNTRCVKRLQIVDLHDGTSAGRGPRARVARQQEAQVSVPRILPIPVSHLKGVLQAA